ncbi:protein translocase subunit SecF [Agarivorans sp. MS3-6]|uniref:protein translocase subunit SecF n=1 Tax=Agarivorans sp. TSD2052 TaxID=2937286 RepID=UPI00200FEE14|nr:protein translocase subunit SecF [Agarivorans sp. TSD2052]UPW20719.1 protein translocase subunit SecF [Agarivorans sp. TSD2052]
MSNNLLTRIRLLMSGMSVLLFIFAVTLISVKSFNWGLDFTGGVVAEVRLDKSLKLNELKSHLDRSLAQDVQVISSAESGRWLVRYNQPDAISEPLASTLGSISESVEVLNSSVVGPQVGQDMVEQGSLAMFACFILTMIYLSFRFEWRLALGALSALIYDVVIVIGLFSLTGMEFNLTILAAVLAVLGYSLNDSIIIADRARELLRANPKGDTNIIINDTLRATVSRTLVTSGTTLATVSSLWLLGGPALEGFAIALCLGIASGTWSSVSLGVTLPQMIGLKPEHYQVKDIDTKEAYL